MKSKILRLLAVGLIQFTMASAAWAVALPFSATQDWSDVPASGVTPSYTVFSDTAPPSWTYNISFSPSATSILTAFLEIRFGANGNSSSGVCTNSFEAWFVDSSSSTFIGQLSCAVGTWATNTFAIPTSLFPTMPASGWSLSLRARETAAVNPEPDAIFLDYAKLYGTYETTVPDPGTLALLGLGLLGLGMSRRRKAA